MTEIACLDRDRVKDGIYRRIFFQDRLATGVLVSVIMIWYLVQIGFQLFAWDTAQARWLFTTESFPQPSPGLFLAIISHSFLPDYTHVFGNAAGLWLFGGESEQHMGPLEVGAFFVLAAEAAVLLGTAISVDSTMGASGGVFAFIGFYCVHMTVAHRDEFQFGKFETASLSDLPPRPFWGLLLIVTPIGLVLYFGAQLAGFVPVARADVVGHLTGLLLGIGYATGRAYLAPSGECWSRSG